MAFSRDVKLSPEASALAPTLVNKPIAVLTWDGKNYSINKDSAEILADNEESASFKYLKILIEQFLRHLATLKELGLSEHGLKTSFEEEKAKHLSAFLAAVEKDLPGFDFEGLNVGQMYWEDDAVCVPVGGGEYRFSLNKDNLVVTEQPYDMTQKPLKDIRGHGMSKLVDGEDRAVNKLIGLAKTLKEKSGELTIPELYDMFNENDITAVIKPDSLSRSAAVAQFEASGAAYDNSFQYPFNEPVELLYYLLVQEHWTALYRLCSMDQSSFIFYMEKMMLAMQYYREIDKVDHSKLPLEAMLSLKFCPPLAGVEQILDELKEAAQKLSIVIPLAFNGTIEESSDALDLEDRSAEKGFTVTTVRELLNAGRDEAKLVDELVKLEIAAFGEADTSAKKIKESLEVAVYAEEIFVVMKDDAIIGMRSITPPQGKTVESRGIAVLPGFHRQGIGTMLLDASFEFVAGRKDVDKLIVCTELPDRPGTSYNFFTKYFTKRKLKFKEGTIFNGEVKRSFVKFTVNVKDSREYLEGLILKEQLKAKRASRDFKDTIIKEQAKMISLTKQYGEESVQVKDQRLIVALGTGWIPGYKKGEGGKHANVLNELIRDTMRTFCEERGIPFIDREERDLVEAIKDKKAQAGFEKSKVVVLASAGDLASIQSGLAEIAGSERSVFVGVNGSKLREDSFVRVVEMMRASIEFALNPGSKPSDFTKIPLKAPDTSDGFWIFVPDATPIKDWARLEALYQVQISA